MADLDQLDRMTLTGMTDAAYLNAVGILLRQPESARIQFIHGHKAGIIRDVAYDLLDVHTGSTFLHTRCIPRQYNAQDIVDARVIFAIFRQKIVFLLFFEFMR